MTLRIRLFARDFGRLLERLLAFYSADEALDWMRSEHPAFGTSPARMLWNGRTDEVEAEINRLETGAYV